MIELPAPAPLIVSVTPLFTSRSPTAGLSREADVGFGIVSLNVPAPSVIVFAPPTLSAAWTAARNVHVPPVSVETHDVLDGVASAASDPSLTVKVAACAEADTASSASSAAGT